MPALRELQRQFARGMWSPSESGTIEAWIEGDAIAEADRLSIYRNTMTGVITNAMRLTYPVVERLVGAKFFAGAVGIFMAANLPRSAYLNAYGADFAAFLAGFTPAASLPYLPDVAALEWAVAGAAAADDAPALDARDLAGFDPIALEALRLIPHPSLRLVRLTTPADTIWRILTAGDEAELAGITLATEPFTVILHRRTEGIALRRLSELECAVTEPILQGRPLGEALMAGGGIDAVALLAEHLASGRFTRTA
ncbi:MAG TPA: DNA-binding domain-containing protein [Candidatus Cybelea sp.]|nr:DNA-binding domain-containing protein [Candidatus Cybelea sp.]